VRVLLQRVSEAHVTVEGRVAGSIGRGVLLLVGFAEGDGAGELEWMARKIVDLRIFPDQEGRMNLGLPEVGGGILVVSQFTLYGELRKGRRPSFARAADPERAIPLYESFLDLLREFAPGPVESGEFGAMMQVALVNEGPVTLWLEREARTGGGEAA